MKVLQINSVYNLGSTGKITAVLHQSLVKNGCFSVVAYGRKRQKREDNLYKTCSEFEANVHKFLSFFSGNRYGGLPLATARLIRLIKREKPDIVHLQCINGYFVNIYKLLSWLKKHGINTVLTLHAEFMYTANCSHAFECDGWLHGCVKCQRIRESTNSFLRNYTHKSWLRMKKAFSGFSNLEVVSVSPWLMDRAKKSPILFDKKHSVVLNGLDEKIFHFDDNRIASLSEKNGYLHSVFYVTPMFSDAEGHIKGGHFVIELAKQMKDYLFVVAGPYDKGIVFPKNVLALGRILNQNDLASFYSSADVTIITSKIETFSMVVAESLCCGTPVVGFFSGGPETIAIKEYSKFTDYGDLRKMKEYIEFFAEQDFNKQTISKQAIEKYSQSTMCKSYLNVYLHLIKSHSGANH